MTPGSSDAGSSGRREGAGSQAGVEHPTRSRPGSLAAQRDVLLLVLDALVPVSGGFPGAGTVALEHVLAMAGASADVDERLSRGLQAVDQTARASGATGFAALSPDDREDVLGRVERSHRELFEALLRHTYDGYYSHPAVLAQLGLEPGPIHPRGHRIESVDLPELARVSARGPLYR